MHSVEKQCVTIEFLDIMNRSNYWGCIIIMFAILVMTLVWYLLPLENYSWLRLILSFAILLVIMYTISMMFDNRSYFLKYGMTNC